MHGAGEHLWRQIRGDPHRIECCIVREHRNDDFARERFFCARHRTGAAFFQRALHGDLGDKAKTERTRFAFKTPLSFSLLQVIRMLVPFQDGPVGTSNAPP